MVVINEVERIWKDLYFPGVTEENNDKPQSGMSVSHLRSEVGTTQIQGRSVNHMGQLGQ